MFCNFLNKNLKKFASVKKRVVRKQNCAYKRIAQFRTCLWPRAGITGLKMGIWTRGQTAAQDNTQRCKPFSSNVRKRSVFSGNVTTVTQTRFKTNSKWHRYKPTLILPLVTSSRRRKPAHPALNGGRSLKQRRTGFFGLILWRHRCTWC